LNLQEPVGIAPIIWMDQVVQSNRLHEFEDILLYDKSEQMLAKALMLSAYLIRNSEGDAWLTKRWCYGLLRKSLELQMDPPFDPFSINAHIPERIRDYFRDQLAEYAIKHWFDNRYIRSLVEIRGQAHSFFRWELTDDQLLRFLKN